MSCLKSEKIIIDIEQAEQIKDKKLMIRKLKNLKEFVKTQTYTRARKKERIKINQIYNKYSKVIARI